MQNLLDYTEAAEQLSISTRALRRLVKSRSITVVRISARCLRFAQSDIDAFKAAHREPALTPDATPAWQKPKRAGEVVSFSDRKKR